MEWINEITDKLQAGDWQTAAMVLIGLLIVFFVLKLLVNSFKAIIIVVAAIVLLAVLMPESNIIDKTKELGSDALDYAKDKASKETLDSIKEKLDN